eukprot:COSAG05_NODE_1467_length_4795_cov_1.624574_3_plen_74_part_00
MARPLGSNDQDSCKISSIVCCDYLQQSTHLQQPTQGQDPYYRAAKHVCGHWSTLSCDVSRSIFFLSPAQQEEA